MKKHNTGQTGLDRLALAEAQHIAELVQIKVDGFMKLASGLLGEGYEEVYKEAFIEILFNGILEMNNNQDPRIRVNSARITPEVVTWYEKAALAMKENEALREKYRKVLSGEYLTEH